MQEAAVANAVADAVAAVRAEAAEALAVRVAASERDAESAAAEAAEAAETLRRMAVEAVESRAMQSAQTAAEQLKASVVSYVDEAVAAASAAHERAVRAIGNGGGGLDGVQSGGGESHPASAAVATVADAAVRAMVAEVRMALESVSGAAVFVSASAPAFFSADTAQGTAPAEDLAGEFSVSHFFGNADAGAIERVRQELADALADACQQVAEQTAREVAANVESASAAAADAALRQAAHEADVAARHEAAKSSAEVERLASQVGAETTEVQRLLERSAASVQLLNGAFSQLQTLAGVVLTDATSAAVESAKRTWEEEAAQAADAHSVKLVEAMQRGWEERVALMGEAHRAQVIESRCEQAACVGALALEIEEAEELVKGFAQRVSDQTEDGVGANGPDAGQNALDGGVESLRPDAVAAV
eukprot:2053554-Pleurochrysis_carterae.AAC.1